MKSGSKPPRPESSSNFKKSSKESSEKQMNPDQDSFKISPIYGSSAVKDKKAKAPRNTTGEKSSNLSLSGSDERDFNYLGTEEKDS
jgi:hypothetical protein